MNLWDKSDRPIFHQRQDMLLDDRSLYTYQISQSFIKHKFDTLSEWLRSMTRIPLRYHMV